MEFEVEMPNQATESQFEGTTIDWLLARELRVKQAEKLLEAEA